MQRDSSNFDILAICEVLAAHQVDYVLIGGVAAVLQGADLLTHDFDLVPEKTDDNLLASPKPGFSRPRVSRRKSPALPDGDWSRVAYMDFETGWVHRVLFTNRPPKFEQLKLGHATKFEMDYLCESNQSRHHACEVGGRPKTA